VGEAAQQAGLMLGPYQYIAVVEIVRHGGRIAYKR
jgi:hypothetical protein